MNGVKLTTGADVEKAWAQYQAACDKLAEMRLFSTDLEIQIQANRAEELLQTWIDRTQFFKTSLN